MTIMYYKLRQLAMNQKQKYQHHSNTIKIWKWDWKFYLYQNLNLWEFISLETIQNIQNL